MPEALLIAAGGGGDVIAAAAIARALGLEPKDALIATLAWDRLLIDPIPGPRSPADFAGLSHLGQQNVEIVADTTPRTPGTSTLPRLRSELGHRLALLDPRHGATGVAEQLGDLIAQLSGARAAYLLDVGGDVLADGTEPGLKSPLADAMMLAAAAHLASAIELLVAGPGLDGELTETMVLKRLHRVGAKKRLDLNEAATASAVKVLEWHPSEASALLIAAARGVSGIAEIRDAGTQIRLTSRGRQVWAAPLSTAAARSLADTLFDTTSFDECEESLQGSIGWTELDYERRKVKTKPHAAPCPRATDSVIDDARQFEREARSRGTDLVTFRRVAEAVGFPQAHVELRDMLLANSPERHRPPLWAVNP